jgi:hypothetical protein
MISGFSLSMLRSFRFPWAGLTISPTSVQVNALPLWFLVAALPLFGAARSPMRSAFVLQKKIKAMS